MNSSRNCKPEVIVRDGPANFVTSENRQAELNGFGLLECEEPERG